MIDAADRMRALGKQLQGEGAPSSIFGSAAGLAQSIESEEQFRISVYPFICPEKPETATGLAACLGYLLEQYRSTKVYRCFAKIDLNDGSNEIGPSDYQFFGFRMGAGRAGRQCIAIWHAGDKISRICA